MSRDFFSVSLRLATVPEYWLEDFIYYYVILALWFCKRAGGKWLRALKSFVYIALTSQEAFVVLRDSLKQWDNGLLGLAVALRMSLEAAGLPQRYNPRRRVSLLDSWRIKWRVYRPAVETKAATNILFIKCKFDRHRQIFYTILKRFISWKTSRLISKPKRWNTRAM